MATIKIKGRGLNDLFAERLVEDYGPDVARDKCCGEMLKAVERVIARMGPKPSCAGGGVLGPGVMCGSVTEGGKLCGGTGECEHRRHS